ncbi:Arf GTPase activating protein, partial [Fragilariopsis cylindrus CCMP1102]
PGNLRCIDCGNCHPDWASVSYGILLCVRCSGRHRSYGVATSRVRSISMDNWSYSQVLSMLEGGNEQLHNFY